MRSEGSAQTAIIWPAVVVLLTLLGLAPTSAWGWADPPPPRVIYQPAPLPPPPPPPPVLVVERQDPYDTAGIVIVGGGLGGLMFKTAESDGLAVAPSYLLHLGLAVGAAEFALRLNLAPDALTLQDGAGELEVGIYATQATFNYRFLRDTTIHPVAGLGLEMIAASPARGDDGYAFALTARFGLELAYPLADGALALGLDLTGHRPFARTESFTFDLQAMLGFGAYVDYRF